MDKKSFLPITSLPNLYKITYEIARALLVVTVLLCILFLTESCGYENRDQTNPTSNFCQSLAYITQNRCEPWEIGKGLAGYVWRSKKPKAILLLQHGYGESAFRHVKQYHQIIPKLVNQGITVYAFDLWGHGNSSGTRGLLDVSYAIKDHLLAREKLKPTAIPIFLLGHSLGGLVTTGSAIEKMENIAGMILMSPSLHYESNNSFTRLFTLTLAGIYPNFGIIAGGDYTLLYRGAENDNVLKNDSLFHRGSIPVGVIASTLKASHYYESHYSKIQIPLLVLHGTSDKATDPNGSKMVYEMASSKNKTLHLIEGGFHELLNDSDKEQVYQIILSWIQSQIK